MEDTPFDNLPDDDEQAFAVLEQYERTKLEQRVNQMEDDWPIRQAQFDYINTVWAAANAAGVAVLMEYPIRLPDDGGFRDHYAQFAAHAKRIVYDINFRAARIRRRESVELSSEAKGKIHALIAKIRDVIEGSDLEEEKKRALLDRVGGLAKEVDRSRTQLRVAMNMVLDVSATAGQAAANLTPLRKLVDKVIDVLAIAWKETPKQLPAPPKRIEPPPMVKSDNRSSPDREFFNQDLDDEIPF